MSKAYISKTLKWQVFERDRYTCRYCGVTGVPLEADHVWPESRGGTTEPGNLVAACETCNRQKRDKLGIYPLPVDYLERISYANRVIAWYEEYQEGEQRARERDILMSRMARLAKWSKTRAWQWGIISMLGYSSILSIVLWGIVFLIASWPGNDSYPLAPLGIVFFVGAFALMFVWKRAIRWYVKTSDKLPA